jgi:hypothetical protein
MLAALWASVVVAGSLFWTEPAAAQEGTHYMPGVFNIQDFAVPGPGFYFQNFFVAYSTDTFRDRDGDAVESIGPIPLEIDLDVVVDFPVFYWISDTKVLGADFGVVVGVPIQNADISAQLPTLGLDADESNVGFGDLMIEPVMLGWHQGRWDYYAGYIFYAPSGEYDVNAPDNLGLGYWTHEVQGSVVYRGGEDRLWTLGSLFTYDVHTNREGVDIQPGNNLTIEWGVSKILLPSLVELGVTGYSQWQVTDDDGSDVTRDPEIHDQAHALGGQFSWTSQSQKVNLAFRYLKEFAVEDRFEGDLGVFTVTYVF